MPTKTSSVSPNPVYQDPTRRLEERVTDLLSRMTLKEKIYQMVHDAPAIERLSIPAYNWWNECLHGVARAGVATVFPQAVGLAATWDVALMGEVATAISDEARAKHNEFMRRGTRQIYTGLTFWSPNVNIFRDPRWGRGQETYGEDPYLTARLGVTFINALQGDDPVYLKLVATPKHFAVHSGPELERHYFDARVSERDLYETYLPAFEACVVEAKAASVMGAYNRLNGEPCCASPALLRKILRGEWGFDGYVVSDCWAIDDIFGGHKVVETPAEASALAVNAGCDLECGCTYTSLLEAAEQGLIDQTTIDQAVARLFSARFRLGMFDPPDQTPFARIPYTINDSPEHRALALRAAQQSIVLLKNEPYPPAESRRPLLPLAKGLKSIAVIGPNADDLSVLMGNYSGAPSRAVTPLEGVRRKVSPATAVYYAQGCEIAPGVPPLRAVPSACLRPSAGSAGYASHGLTGMYFGDVMFSDSPALVRNDPAVDFAWHDSSPLGGYGTDPFSVRWTGLLIPPMSGRYLVGVRGSSGYQLWLDGRELLPYERNEHHFFTRVVPVELEAGRLYDLRLDYFNSGRDPQVQLLWALPDQDYAAEALQAARQAEVVVMVMGLSPEIEGEEMPIRVEGFVGGDRTDITLPRTQEALLQQIHALGKPIVLVLMGGSALAVNWAEAHVPAILAAWYPGEEGGTAIADVLFGDYNPGGRLPVTFYRSVDDLPAFEEYQMEGRTYRYFRGQPLYPFGHGLSYTTFKFDRLRLSCLEAPVEGQVDVRADVTNTGSRAGEEVIQLYISHPDATAPRPIKEMKGFKRINLEPGECKTVVFGLHTRQLGYYDEALRYAVHPGRVEVRVGSSSQNLPLAGQFRIVGPRTEVSKVFSSRVSVE